MRRTTTLAAAIWLTAAGSSLAQERAGIPELIVIASRAVLPQSVPFSEVTLFTDRSDEASVRAAAAQVGARVSTVDQTVRCPERRAEGCTLVDTDWAVRVSRLEIQGREAVVRVDLWIENAERESVSIGSYRVHLQRADKGWVVTRKTTEFVT